MDTHISWLEAEEKDLESTVLAEYRNDEVWRHIAYLTTLTRMAGTEDELKAARYIRGKLQEYGVDATVYEFDAYVSHPGEASLEILVPIRKSIPCMPWAFIVSTPPEGIEAEVIVVGKGAGQDYQGVNVQGRIVLMEGGKESRREAARIAEAMGAVAQIHVTPGKNRAINMDQLRDSWGSPTPETIDRIPKTPAVAICSEDGHYLVDLGRKSRVVVRMRAEAWRGYRKVRLPVGAIPGVKEPEKYVLVGGHYCSWFSGATDNAAANAVMLEMAGIFSRYRERLGRGVRFAWWTGHEQGTYAGSTWYLDNFWNDIRDNAVAYLTMDGLGRIGSSGFESRNTEEIRKFRECVVKDVLGLKIKSKRVVKHGDQSFWGMGLPSCTGKPGFSDEQTENGGLPPVWYSHTAEDTLDKLDMKLVSIPFKVNMVSILRLCNNRVLPFEFVTVAKAFKTALDELQRDSESILDLTSLTAQVEALEEKAVALNKSIGENLLAYKKKGSDERLGSKFEEINLCLMELSRILMPALSSRAGKYGQDAMESEYRPIPTLQPLKQLSKMDRNTEQYKALRTALVRARNELSDTLHSASRTLSNALRTM